MFLLAAYLGGVLTILSPCILPVLPFVFARSDQPCVRSGLPILLGMAVTFAMVASLAAVGGGWVVEANYYGRLAAILLMALFGITLLVPQLSERLMRPVVALGARLSQKADGTRKEATFGSSLVLGVATGMLWAPCAGPILGLLLTGAALNGASLGTSLLLASLCCGSGDFAGHCPPHRRPSLRRDEAFTGSGRVDSTWARRRCARRCRRDRIRPRHRTARARVAREHERAGAGTRRPAPRDDGRTKANC